MRLTFLFLALMAITPVFGQKKLEKSGVDTRKYVPAGLQLKTKAPLFGGFIQDGEKFDSRYAYREGNVLILFVRGVWSEPCLALLKDVADNIETFKEEGTQVVVVTPEPSDRASRLASIISEEFIVISDSGNKIAKQFEVIYHLNDEGLAQAQTAIGMSFEEYYQTPQAFMPVTASYVIGQNGYVMWKHFEFDPTDRPSAADIIDRLPPPSAKGK